MTEESPTAWQKLVASLKKYLWELEPVFTAGTAQAIVALVVALFHPAAWVAGVIEAAFAIVAALYAMLKVEPKRAALFTGLVTAVGTLLVALGVPHVNSGLISGFNGVLAIVLASLLREKVSPVLGQTVRQGLSQLRHPGPAGPQSAAGVQADPAAGVQADPPAGAQASPATGSLAGPAAGSLAGPAAGSLEAPAAGAGMARFASDATAAADALAQVAADAKAMGAAQVPPPRTGDGQARDVTQTPP